MASTPEIQYTKLFINNEWCDSISGKTFPTINPCTGKVIAHIQEADKADVDLAVKAARKAFEVGSEWRKLTAPQRGALINKFADLIRRDAQKIAALNSLDMGKPIGLSTMETYFAADVLTYYAGWCDKISGKTLPAPANDFFIYTKHEPVGVVGQIIPWNFPTAMIAWKLAPALACGCTLVLKAAEQTPLIGLHIAALAKEAGFPPGVINILNGFGPTAGAAISNHMDIDKVAFTGSIETGRLVMEAAAKSNLKRISLELGGKSPLIIFPDANLDSAVAIAHQGLFMNNGQVCCAGSRTFVHEDIYDEFVTKATEMALAKKVSDPMEEGCDNGPIVNEEQYKKVLALMELGKKEGATLKCGGEKMAGENGGYFVQQTVFADVTDDMTIAKEEIFGPVQSILKFKDIDEVISRANATSYGLGAGVLTNDLKKAMKIVDRIQAGTVWVNCYNMTFQTAPFGGFKQSGFGREMGEYGLKEYTEVKTVTMNLS